MSKVSITSYIFFIILVNTTSPNTFLLPCSRITKLITKSWFLLMYFSMISRYSGFKDNTSVWILLIFMILLGVIFGWRKLSGYIDPSYSFAGLLIAILAIGLLMFHFIMMLKKILKLLSEIFDSATNTRSAVHSHLIVKKAFSGFGIFLIGLLFPFVMFLIDLSPYYLSVSFVLLGIAIWQFYGISRLMSDNLDLARTSFPAYKKYSYENNTKAVNRGWKF